MKFDTMTIGTVRKSGKGRAAGLAFVFLWIFIGGIMHFVATETEASIVPPWMPWPVAAVQRPELFPVPLWALWLRLPVQVGLLWLILWSTRPARD